MSLYDYGRTGSNPYLSTTQFSEDMPTLVVLYSIMQMGGCLDAPDLIPAGGCHQHWCSELYLTRDKL